MTLILLMKFWNGAVTTFEGTNRPPTLRQVGIAPSVLPATDRRTWLPNAPAGDEREQDNPARRHEHDLEPCEGPAILNHRAWHLLEAVDIGEASDIGMINPARPQPSQNLVHRVVRRRLLGLTVGAHDIADVAIERPRAGTQFRRR